MVNVEISKKQLEYNMRAMQIRYLRGLITKMQCADMGVVNDETYRTAIARLEDLVELQAEAEGKDYFAEFDAMELVR